MAGNTMGQFEELTQKILLHLPKMLHIDRRLTATKGTQKADRHKITELVAWGIASARIIHVIEIVGQCWHLETPSGDKISRIQFSTPVKL